MGRHMKNIEAVQVLYSQEEVRKNVNHCFFACLSDGQQTIFSLWVIILMIIAQRLFLVYYQLSDMADSQALHAIISSHNSASVKKGGNIISKKAGRPTME